jgi:hypothetical protein
MQLRNQQERQLITGYNKRKNKVLGRIINWREKTQQENKVGAEAMVIGRLRTDATSPSLMSLLGTCGNGRQRLHLPGRRGIGMQI